MGTVAQYKGDLASGVVFPPLVVFFDGKINWVADGFHRGQAYREAGASTCPCDVRQGTKRDAILYAVGANSTHGLQRTNKDKRRAVMTLLNDAEWSQKSDREVARLAGVSHPFVLSLRSQVITVITSPAQDEQATRKGADGKSYPAKRKPVETKPEVIDELGEPCSPEEASRRIKLAKKLREELMREKSAPVGLVAITDDETEDEPYEEEVDAVAESPREDLTETKEANDAIRIAKTAVDAVWNKCPPAFRWRLKVSIDNHLTELAEG